MKWYHHHNSSVVVSIDGDSLTYYEVRDGKVLQTTELLRYYHIDWIETRRWPSITEQEAHSIISRVLGRRYPENSLSPSFMFTQIDIHMFSSGEANEL